MRERLSRRRPPLRSVVVRIVQAVAPHRTGPATTAPAPTPRLRRVGVTARLAAAVLLLLGALFGAAATAHTAQAAASQPCDIYAAAGTPCVAAHSSVRALYGSYDGRLYQVRRARDGAFADIGVLAPGGYADAAAQDSFCAGTSCMVTEIYDQSPRH
jgi:hypothetical protein